MVEPGKQDHKLKFVSRLGRFQMRFLLAAIVIVVAVALGLHIDWPGVLTNPIVLVVGGLIVGLHLLGAVIAAVLAFLGRKRWAAWRKPAGQLDELRSDDALSKGEKP